MDPVLDIEWATPLKFRRGAQHRLGAISVFHDFEWLDYFADQRTQFSNGLSLVRQLKKDCPKHLEPALLLSAEEDVKEGAREAGDHYVLVINLPRYLKTAAADAASAYFAGGLGPGITRAKGFTDVTDEDLDPLLDRQLDANALRRWIDGDPQRAALLRHVADEAAGASEKCAVDGTASLKAAIEALDDWPPDLVEAVASAAGTTDSGTPRIKLLAALTNDIDGRYAAAETLAVRTSDRLADARAAIDEFDTLVATATATETDVQQFLELNPWLLGLDYARARPRQSIARGAVDFLLERFDGFHDVLELKGPQEQILVTDRPRRGRVAPASGYRLSRALSLAIAQVHAYRDLLRHEQFVHEQFGIENSRDPRFIIVIGTLDALKDEGKRILLELNKSLHRVEIVPYDVIGSRAKAILTNVENQLLFVEDDTQDVERPPDD